VQAELATPPTAVNTHIRQQTARWKLPDRTTLVAHADPTLGGKGRIGLTWSRLTDGDALSEVRAQLSGWLQTAAGTGSTTG